MTKRIESLPVGHVIYTYTDFSKYVEQVTSFMAEGLCKNHTIFYVDRAETFVYVKENLKNIGYSEKQIDTIYFIDTAETYETHEDFNAERVLNNVKQLLHSHVKEGNVLRVWGLVTWRPQKEKTLIPSIAMHEKNIDELFAQVASITRNYIKVCAYDGLALSGALLNELLQTHEYHMTDTNFAPSHLYNKEFVPFEGIAEKIQNENELRNHDARKGKLAITGKLASNIAHELHNSLAVVQGRVQLLDQTLRNDNHQTGLTHLAGLKKGLTQIEQLAAEFLSLAETHVEHQTDVNITTLIEDIKIQMESETGLPTIDIHIHSSDKKMTVLCDKLKMRQVFINIIKNAMEAMESGTIKIDVKDAETSIDIDVSDNGPGIPHDIISQIGEPFMSSKENSVGLGLVISEKIIREHHGNLFLETEIGRGTTFTVRLPKS